MSVTDSKVGEIKTLKDINEIENTLIIVTADHGDMLGERGLWYKMNFLNTEFPEFSGPGVVKGATRNARSLVDILPTLLEVAGGEKGMLGEPIDLRSLLPLIEAER